MGKKLYVGNLGYDVDSSALEQLFTAHGTVSSAQIISDRDTGKSKGFGFVEMGTDAEAQDGHDAAERQGSWRPPVDRERSQAPRQPSGRRLQRRTQRSRRRQRRWTQPGIRPAAHRKRVLFVEIRPGSPWQQKLIVRLERALGRELVVADLECIVWNLAVESLTVEAQPLLRELRSRNLISNVFRSQKTTRP